jgi:hypothetical protein
MVAVELIHLPQNESFDVGVGEWLPPWTVIFLTHFAHNGHSGIDVPNGNQISSGFIDVVD